MAENIEKTKLSILINMTKKFNGGEISQEEMSDFGRTLTLRPYIGLREKIINVKIMQELYENAIETKDIEVLLKFYIKEFFYIILGLYGFIDCSDESLITEENYDLLYPIFTPFILSYCKDDFELYKQMLNASLTSANVCNMFEIINGIDGDALVQAAANNKEVMNQLLDNKDIIESLGKIAVYDDPNTMELIDNIKKAVVKEQLKKKIK